MPNPEPIRYSHSKERLINVLFWAFGWPLWVILYACAVWGDWMRALDNYDPYFSRDGDYQASACGDGT